MVTRRQIRERVMQAVYACISADQDPEEVYGLLLKEMEEEVEEVEKTKNLTGDTKMLISLYYDSVKQAKLYDEWIQKKAENWEIERIALLDRVLMYMAIHEMLNFEDVPVKVSINEYLELAKMFSTPKSSKFINGILDSLYGEFKNDGKIIKSGRGLIDQSYPKDSNE